MDCKESQEEELEVLMSIYDGDKNFKKVSSVCFQYKIGEDETKSFILEICWPGQYPNIPPNFNLDVFYNNKLIPEVKANIIEKLQSEAEMNVGIPMTYTLIEWARENAEELTCLQPEKSVNLDSASPEEEKTPNEVISSSKKEKKPQLSKSQKRKLADKLDSRGEHVRGWDWIDVVKHLSQIGPKQTDPPS